LLRSITFNFSHVFKGVIWNMKTSEDGKIIILEVRNSETKIVKFSALDLDTHEFLWKEKMLDEPWWINLTAVAGDIVLFTLYTDTNNPDKKAALAYQLVNGELMWWNNDFSISAIAENAVIGSAEKYGKREMILDVRTGKEIELTDIRPKTAEIVLRPQQYTSDHAYFQTVKTFFNQKFNLSPITALEYLEYDSLIFISCYLQENELANYLFIISADGNLLLKERLGEHLKGIGLDTFFVLSGCVFFVKNKGELVSYKIL
jgi:hypothetical protein